jgi:uncharacterized protein
LRRPVIFSVPEVVLKIVMGEMAEIVLHSQRVIPRAAMDSGYRFRFQTLEPALRSLLES